MRKLWLVVAVGLVMVGGEGCRRRVPKPEARYAVVVDDTPEGKRCQRECMVVFNACHGGNGRNIEVCRSQENGCLETCPGARWVNAETGQPVLAQAPASAPVEPTAPPAAAAPTGPMVKPCNAEELPEWQTAGAAEKKALLDRCRARPAPAQ